MEIAVFWKNILQNYIPGGPMSNKPLLVQRMAWYQTCGNHLWWRIEMETFSALLVFRAGKFTGRRWIPHTKASDAEPWCFLLSTPEPTVEQRMEPPVIKDAVALIMTSSILWLRKISAVSSETEGPGASFMTRTLQSRFREFGAPIIYMIPFP